MNSLFKNILDNAKLIYKKSNLIDNEKIEELALSIIIDIKNLQNDKKEYIPRERVTISDEKSKDVNILAYVFSEYEHTSLFPDDNQSDAIQKIRDLLDVKYHTFKNKRDYYDTYTNSPRKGWEKELSDSLQEVFDELKVLSKEEVLTIANNIIKKYKA